MQHTKHLRKEKDCLNCGAEVPHIYCPVCGQPNREPVLSIKDLLGEFVHGLTHFDGKFFSTAKLLFSKPGFLSKAYLDGKRSRYLPPVQLYLFTSAIFFFIFHGAFNLATSEQPKNINGAPPKQPLELDLFMGGKDSAQLHHFSDVASYEKYQDTLPTAQKDGFLKARLMKKSILLKNDFEKNQQGTMHDLIGNFGNNIPKLLFASLPFLALFLNLLYWRRKRLNFVAHLVFVIHWYVFLFLIILLKMLFSKIASLPGLSIVDWLGVACYGWMAYYGYKAIRNFYGAGRGKALLYYFFTLAFSFATFLLIFISYLFLGLFFY